MSRLKEIVKKNLPILLAVMLLSGCGAATEQSEIQGEQEAEYAAAGEDYVEANNASSETTTPDEMST